MKRILTTAICLAAPTFALSETVTADVWADNWFAMYVDGKLVLEDSVPISTERSFNSETASFEVPAGAQISFVAKDFKENDTGLEYIYSLKQQMGDGGIIVQILDAQGGIFAVSDASLKCLVVHHAPVEISCADEWTPAEGDGACRSIVTEEPAGWQLAGFDDSGWNDAVVHSESAVRPKDGYDKISWDASAKIIWGPDLERDNTILCRIPASQ